jgi:hypothetical protein
MNLRKIVIFYIKVAIKNIWLDKNIKDAIDESRVHHQLFPQYAEIELGFSSVRKLNFFKKYSKV